LSLDAFISKLEGLEVKAKVVVDKTIKEEAPDANREQLEQGVNADGEPITKQKIRAGATTYSKGYAKQRKRKGLQTAHIDAKFTGKYHNSIKAKKKGKDYELKATDSKANTVEENLGNLVGLNERAVIEVEKALKTELEALIIKELA
jgi:hypothetical protein